MKKIITLLLLAICCSVAYAQPQQPPRQNHPAAESTQMQNLQNVIIDALVSNLRLSNDQAAKFSTLYIEYDNANRAAAATHLSNTREINEIPPQRITHEQMTESMNSQFDLSQQLIDIKKQYFLLFDQILSPSQMMDFYKRENSIRTRIQREYRNRQAQE